VIIGIITELSTLHVHPVNVKGFLFA